MDFDTLNGYLLALIAVFMMLFYAALVVTVCRDLIFARQIALTELGGLRRGNQCAAGET